MNFRKWPLIVATIALTGTLFYAQLTAAPDSASPKAELGKPAPDFELKDVYGKTFKLSDFEKKIVVLEWINKDCPVSRGCHDKEIMQKTYRKYADKGVVWLAIDSTAQPKPVEPESNRVYAAKQNLAYPILHDPEGKVGHAYSAQRTPHMYVIDKSGKLVYMGAIDDKNKTNYVAAAIEDLLADRAVSRPRTDAYGCGVKYAR